MFPLSLHGSATFQEAQLLWEQENSGRLWSCSTWMDLGFVFVSFPLETILQCFCKYVAIIFERACDVWFGLLFKSAF